jgi:hypothetical protein
MMKISLDGLLQLAGTDAERFQKLGDLARRLNMLDEERAAILVELAEFGVSAEDSTPTIAPVSRPQQLSVPRCVVCGDPGEQTIDDKWYCGPHGDEAIP